MMKLQSQDEEDQLIPPARASLNNECLTPDDSTLDDAGITQHGPRPSVAVLAIAFMEGVKAEFGAQSSETFAIVEVLRTFGKGGVTKRETLSTILNTLQGHDHLERGLMAVLNHSDSRWDHEDFDALPLQQPMPHFLQPAHEPKMRLPTLTSPWDYGGDRMLSAADSAMSSAFDQDVATGTHNAPFSTRDEQDHWYQPARSMISSPHLSKPLDDVFSSQRNVAPSWPATDQDASMDPSQLTLRGATQHTSSFPYWQDSDRGPMLGEEDKNQLFTHEAFGNTQPAWSGGPIQSLESLSLPHQSESIKALSSQRLAPARQPGSILAPDPLDSYRENHDLAMLPPSRKRSHGATDLRSHVQGQHVPGEEIDQAKTDPEQVTSYSTQPNTAPKRGRVEGSGSYIHALCGKGFSSRYKVKKHHWGNDVDNINTTTGCWYKHKRPNCSWDDHPSCKEQPKAPTSVRLKANPASRQQRDSTRAGIRPKPEHTPQDLPTSFEPHAPIEQHDNKSAPLKPYANGDINYSSYLPYHPHTLPASSSPFESLLTAVNFAAEIESPMPQRRNDSVVASNLDAHAIAAEHIGEHNNNWYPNQAMYAQGNIFGYYGNLPPRRHGTSLSMESASVANSTSPRVANSLPVYPEDHTFSAQGDPGAMYRHSYLNSRNPVAWPPARHANEYSSALSTHPSEGRED